MLRKFFLFLVLSLTGMTLIAQFDLTDTSWELADISFSYPADWDEPFAVQRFGIESLLLAQEDVTSPDRAPEVPIVVMSLLPYDILPDDATPFLIDRLNEFDIQAEITLTSTLMDFPAVWIQGKSRDEAYMAIGIATLHDDGVLTVIVHGSIDDANLLETIFQTVTRTMVAGVNTPVLELAYGTIWQSTSLFGEVTATYLDVRALTLDESSQTLLAVDATSGVLRFDISTGRLFSRVPFAVEISPSDIAVGADGKIFVADVDCACIHVLVGDTWQEPLQGFGLNAPHSIATTSDGKLYATDLSEDNIAFIRVFDGESENQIAIEQQLSDQALIAKLENDTLALLTTTNDVLIAEGAGFSDFISLNSNVYPDDFTVMGDFFILMSNSEGILFFNANGDLVDSIPPITSNEDSWFEVTGIATLPDASVFMASNDANTGIISAHSKRVLPDQVGLPYLSPNRPVGGSMSEGSAPHVWLLNGKAQQTFDLSLAGDSPYLGYSLALRLLAPDGRELAYNDGSELADEDLSQANLTAAIQDITLRQDGVYEIYIEPISGEGEYQLNLAMPLNLTLNPDETIIYGDISAAKSSEQWLFTGQSGTSMTISLQSLSPIGLDPVLRILDTRGTVLAENDDVEVLEDDTELSEDTSDIDETEENTDPTEDDTLEFADDTTFPEVISGSDSQIVDFPIPYNGNFIIEAGSFDGVGPYQLSITIADN